LPSKVEESFVGAHSGAGFQPVIGCAHQGADARVRPYTKRTNETAAWYRMAGPAGFQGGCPIPDRPRQFWKQPGVQAARKKTRGNPDPGFPRKIKDSGSVWLSFPYPDAFTLFALLLSFFPGNSCTPSTPSGFTISAMKSYF